MGNIIGLLIGLIVMVSPGILLVLLVILLAKAARRMAHGVYLSYTDLAGPVSLDKLWVTSLLLALLVIVYICELLFQTDRLHTFLAPSAGTLLAMGGISHISVGHGEWYRLFMAPLLHGGVLHLLFNGIALYFAGRVLERQLGWSWFLAIYLSSGLAGTLASTATNEQAIVGVGASGAIMGLFAGVLVASFHSANREKRAGLLYFSLRVLIPSVLPHDAADGVGHVDIAAHVGGALGGALCALIMLWRWPADAPLPEGRAIAYALAGLGVMATLASGWTAISRYPAYAALGQSSEQCLEAMVQTARNAHADPKAYIKENGDYLRNCMGYYLNYNYR